MKKVEIIRTKYEKKQTLGYLIVYDELDREIFTCMTLELPWLNNQQSISCIPQGTYSCLRVTSPRLGVCYKLIDVKNRSSILIHTGNFHSEIRGCILVGQFLKDINKDGNYDINNSISTMNTFQTLVGREIALAIHSS